MRALWLAFLLACGPADDTGADTDVQDPDGDGFLPPDDCDDADGAVHPGADEIIADDVDQDCDGTEICFSDADDDGYVAAATIVSEDADCQDPGEGVPGDPDGDCADGDPARNPAATEVCDAMDVDENCDGLIDEEDPNATGC